MRISITFVFPDPSELNRLGLVWGMNSWVDSGRSAPMTAFESDDLDVLLEQLEAEERELSAQRRKLHDRLASFPNEVTIEKERELSKRRSELHVRIDALRAERSRGRDAQRDTAT
jgi:hypothetical protein